MTLARALRDGLHGHLVVVGIGNPRRGDDAAGSVLARRLAGAPGITSFDAEETPERALGSIAAARPDSILLVDAVELGADPGTVVVAGRGDLARRCPDTHRASLGLVMEYLERTTGAHTRLLGIQPRAREFGAPLSPEVEASVDALVAILRGAGDTAETEK